MICENCNSDNTAILYKGVYGCFDCFCSFKIKTMAKKAITITLDEQVINDAKKRAEHNNRPFSNHIEWLLIKDIREGEKNNKITSTDHD